MKIALAQINTIVGDLKGNCNKIINYIQQAKNKKCDLVIFPELTITGYPPEDLLYQNSFIRDVMKKTKQIAKESKNIAVIFGTVEFVSDKLYNACIVCVSGKVISTYHKHLLPNYGVFDEQRYFKKGNQEGLFTYKKQIFGVNICEDIWYSDICKAQARKGAEVIINISCSPYYRDKLKDRERMLSQRAKEIKTYICYCNLVGGQDELVFDGGSMIINSEGTIVSQAPQFEEKLITYTLNSTAKYSNEVVSQEEEIFKALKLGLRDYVSKNGFKKVVLGLSGGIDSAVVAKLAVDTLGKKNVICLSLPSKYNSKETKSDAKRLAKNLGLEFHEIAIEKMVTAFQKSFPFKASSLASENIQARIRGNIIMAYSNTFGALPVACGNKSEYAVGYATIYGDMCGGFAPLKDVPKTLVYKLAQWTNLKGEAIPKSIIERPPSAELRNNQKDSDALPNYDKLDTMIEDYIEKNKPIDKKIARMINKSEYKRRQSPIGIKITKRAFDKDYRMPIVNKYE